MLNIWDANWGLELDLCPCDLHFVEFLAESRVGGATIYHFGSGGHHLVGAECARAGQGNVVMSITASPQEHAAYERLIIENPSIAHSYVCYFGDIYTFNRRLMPLFDIVTAFHLGEFRTEANDAYGALTDWELLEALCDQTRPGGRVVFYKGSDGWRNTISLIERAVEEGLLRDDGVFKTLRIMRRVRA
jgi:hypothetical protein